MTHEDSAIISFTDMSFKYAAQGEPTLKNLNLQIYPGEKVLILGASGSGKSTFANCINGLVPHAYPGEITGKVMVNGIDVANSSLFELSKSIGTVLQDTDHQFVGLTVEEDIAFALENSCMPSEQMREQVVKWAKAVNVADLLTSSPHDLSGGQKQRVSMAGVLVDEVPILLFDEPLANLDPASGYAMTQLIEQIHQQTNATIIIIEHRLEDVLAAQVDRVIVFAEGEIVADTTPAQLLRSPLLAQLGIREPLWVSALKYAQVDLEIVGNLESLQQLTGSTIGTQLTAWQAAQPALPDIAASEPLLTIKNLYFSYSADLPEVLHGINLTLGKGEIIALVGQNGAGKSTLAQLICGFVRATKGEITWKGANTATWSVKQIADHVGYVMQNPNQMITQVQIYDEVALGLRYRGYSEEEIAAKVDKVLQVCGLYSLKHWPISALSYGQKKRLTIASILVLDPQVIILDEPTAGQDYKHYTELMEFLKSINDLGITILMVTHDMHLMLEYAHRALVMVGGQLVADTTPVAVLTNPSLVEQAALRPTSLFTLATRFTELDPIDFTGKFIAYDRQVRVQARTQQEQAVLAQREKSKQTEQELKPQEEQTSEEQTSEEQQTSEEGQTPRESTQAASQGGKNE